MTSTSANQESAYLVATEHWIEVDGVRVHYYAAGQAGSTVILLHGGGVDSALVSWKAAIGPLAHEHRVYALDWPGFGDSDKPDIEYSVDYYVSFLARFMDALGVDRASLVGISLGGAIAIGFALRWTRRVSRLVLVDSYGLQSEAPFAALSYALVHAPFINELTWKLMARSPWMTRWSLRQFLSDPQAITDDLFREVYALMQQPGVGRAWRTFQRNEVTPKGLRTVYGQRLAELTMPVLIIHGQNDRPVPVVCAQEAHRLIPNSKLVILPGCGHWPPREQPEVFNREVAAFLKNSKN